MVGVLTIVEGKGKKKKLGFSSIAGWWMLFYPYKHCVSYSTCDET